MTCSPFDPEDGCLGCGTLLDEDRVQAADNPAAGGPFCDQQCEDRYDEWAMRRAVAAYRRRERVKRIFRWLFEPAGQHITR